MSENFSGCCQCRAVSYNVVGTSTTLFACHCSECQKQSSSAFGMALWVKVLSTPEIVGTLKTWVRRLPGGKSMFCDFCPSCGTRIFHRIGDQFDVISIKPGTLDSTAGLQPVAHIWTQSSQCWFELDERVLLYPGNPDSFDAATEAWDRAKENR